MSNWANVYVLCKFNAAGVDRYLGCIYLKFQLQFPLKFPLLQGSPFKLTGYWKQVFSDYSETTETCDTAMERKFCGLFEDNLENCEKLPYEA